MPPRNQIRSALLSSIVAVMMPATSALFLRSFRLHLGLLSLPRAVHAGSMDLRGQHRAGTSALSKCWMSSGGGVGGSHDDSAGSLEILDPLVVCGPSGVGKGTIIQRYMEEAGKQSDGSMLQFGFSVSHTTRSPRPGEQDGVHYHFVPKAEMESLLANNSNQEYFVEWAQVHGNYYGTSWDALRRVQREEGGKKKCLLDIDVQGVRRLKELEQRNADSNSSFVFAPKYIFIAPPSLETLQARLVDRATESASDLAVRLGNAASELEYGWADGNFDAVIVNQDLDVAVADFANAVKHLYPQQQP